MRKIEHSFGKHVDQRRANLSGALLNSWNLFTDFQVETFSSTKEKILSHRSKGRQSSTSPSRTKGVVAEQIPAVEHKS